MRASSSPMASPHPQSGMSHLSGGLWTGRRGKPQGLAPGPPGGPRKCAQPLKNLWGGGGGGGGAGSTAWPAGHCCPGLLSLCTWAFASGNLGSGAWRQPAHPPLCTPPLPAPTFSSTFSSATARSCHMCDPSPSPLSSFPAPGLGLTPGMPNTHPPPLFSFTHALTHSFNKYPLIHRSPCCFMSQPGQTMFLPSGSPDQRM